MNKSAPNFKSLFLFLIFSCLAGFAFLSCLHISESDTVQVRFSNPNENSIQDNIESIKVLLAYDNGDTLVIFEGSKESTGFLGPWEASSKKSNVVLIIIQYDINGLEISNEKYSYTFKNKTFVIDPKLEITPSKLSLQAGAEPIQLAYKLFPSSLELPIQWSSSNPEFASVTNQGIITPLKEGTLQIIGAADDLTDTCYVTVLSQAQDKDTLTILSPLENVLASAGENAEFKIMAEGESISYRWSLDGEIVEGQVGSTFTLSAVGLELNNAKISVEVYTKDTAVVEVANLYVINPSDPLAFVEKIPDYSLSEGQSVSIKALVNKLSGVSYSWEKEGNVVSSEAGYSIASFSELDTGLYIINVAWEDQVVSDSFFMELTELEYFEITVAPVANGKVMYMDSSISKLSILKGESANLVFEPDPGYVIDIISLNGVNNDEAALSGELALENINENFNIVASFKKASYSLKISLNDSSMGSVSLQPNSSLFQYGDSVILEAIPASVDYKFTGWLGDISSNESQLVVVMDKNYDLQANFSLIGKYSINMSVLSGLSSGTVTLDPDSNSYNSGTVVSLIASPKEGWKFSGWEGDDNQLTGIENPLEITVGQTDINGAATFSKIPITIELSTLPDLENPGNPQPGKTEYFWGDTIALSANPNTTDGWIFEHWELTASNDGFIQYINSDSTQESADLLVKAETVGAVAHYSQKEYTITPSVTGNGNVTPSTATIVKHGGNADFQISPNSSYEISKITVDGSDLNLSNFSGTYSFENVTSDHSIDVVFQKITHNISVIQVNNGEIRINNSVAGDLTEVDDGSNLTVTFVPDNGYEITNVYIDGLANAAAASLGSYTFTNIQTSHSVTASFTIKKYSVTFIEGTNGSRIGGGALSQTINHGSAASAPSMLANEGWIFDGWDISFSNVTTDLTISAQYSRQTFTVTIAAANGGSVNPSGAQTVFYGSNLNISASPSPSYNDFENWSVTGSLNVTNANSSSTTITNITSDGTVTANFWVCGRDNLVDGRFGNQSYSTVVASSQCWMGENFNGGTYINSSTTTQDATNGTVEKFCWNDFSSLCTQSGGMYIWYEAMGNNRQAKAQGICPQNWHIPDTAEVTLLINSGADIQQNIVGTSTGNGGFESEGFDSGYWTSNYSDNGTFLNPYFFNIEMGLSSSGHRATWDFFGLNLRCIKD